MAKVVKIAKTLRNHWKKSVVATLLLGYGVNYATDKYKTLVMMRAYCKEARKEGNMPIHVGNQPRHLTIILNPTSKDGKSKVLYERYAAPLFHLAGIKTSIVQTEAEGEAKGLMEVMDNTDAVVIAGGDGSLSEAVTGLLRRPDHEKAAKRLPLGILPLGKTNTMARTLFWQEGYSDIKWLLEATMAVIRNSYQPYDVMHIQPDTGKPVYALAKFDWGAFRDTEANISKYWYWGPLKTRIAYLASSLRMWPSSYEANVAYTPPCQGCSKCATKLEAVQLAVNRRWWHSFIKVPKSDISKRDFSKIINDKCGVWNSEEFTAMAFNITTKNTDADKIRLKDSFLEIKYGGENFSRTEFINEGLYHLEKSQLSGNPAYTHFLAKEVQLVPLTKQTQDAWYSIDNEPFEVRPVLVRILSKRVNLYYSQLHEISKDNRTTHITID